MTTTSGVRSRRRRRLVLISAMVLVGLGALAAVFVLPVALSRRPAADLAALVPPPPPGSEGLSWRLEPGTDTSSRGETFGAAESRRVAWRATDAGPVLVQTVHRYADPLRAEYRYRLSGPGPAFRDEFPAFSKPAETFSSRYADRSQTVCAAFTAGEPCQIWFYWARYGQYTMQLRYQGEPAIEDRTFLEYVRYFDDYAGQRLR